MIYVSLMHESGEQTGLDTLLSPRLKTNMSYYTVVGLRYMVLEFGTLRALVRSRNAMNVDPMGVSTSSCSYDQNSKCIITGNHTKSEWNDWI